VSAPRFSKLFEPLRAALLDAAWIQWQALGAQAAAPRAPSSIVDPEALVLVSLWLRDHEPRLWDFLYGFAGLAPRLLSVQRLKRLSALMPADAPRRLAVFARAVVVQGKDPRWRQLAGGAKALPGRPRKIDDPLKRLAQPASLLLRFRAGIGVDVRTDALAYLLGREEAWADVRQIATALSYAPSSVRAALDALSAARFIEAAETRPQRYYASGQRWGALLGAATLAPWQPFGAVYGLSLGLLAWFEREGAKPLSDALFGSLLRDQLEQHRQLFAELKLEKAVLPAFTGEATLWAASQNIQGLAQWLREKA
jgi:hypothetical protein